MSEELLIKRHDDNVVSDVICAVDVESGGNARVALRVHGNFR